MPRFATLLFDLGGVLVENTHLDDLPNLVPDHLRKSDLHDLWLSSPAVRQFERGQIDAATFSAQFVSEWNLALTPGAFLERVADWPKGFYPGAADVLTALRRRHQIAYLSNSNALHWAGFSTILLHADRPFSSHICGLLKPDPDVFSFVISELDVEPGEICFFDDSQSNVEAARRAGMEAYLTKGFGELTSRLGTLGLV
ncbi:MAG: HAD-IA family hydrolase [bacterium]|nr:HAD-IA family hydrolase [bacterium]